MSKEHQKYQQQQSKLQKKKQEMIKTNCYDNLYYPFQVAQQSYMYNYMYPYAGSSCLPYYPAHYMPRHDIPISKQEFAVPKMEEKEDVIIWHPKIKSESAQQKNFLIKIQEYVPSNKQFSQDLETAKGTQKKNNKQLYLVNMSQALPQNCQQDITQLLFRFQIVIRTHIEETVPQKIDINIYEPQFSKQIAEDKQFFEELMICLAQRFRQYKKTKQELIKLIIRRTYHALKIHKNILSEKPEYERLEAFHQKNLATFKSMNVLFLKREFSNQLFVQLFKQFMVKFEDQFEKQNTQKVQRFAIILVSCWLQRSTSVLMHQRKLPWVNTYKRRIQKISLELLKEYEGSTSSKDSETKK